MRGGTLVILFAVLLLGACVATVHVIRTGDVKGIALPAIGQGR